MHSILCRQESDLNLFKSIRKNFKSNLKLNRDLVNRISVVQRPMYRMSLQSRLNLWKICVAEVVG